MLIGSKSSTLLRRLTPQLKHAILSFSETTKGPDDSQNEINSHQPGFSDERNRKDEARGAMLNFIYKVSKEGATGSNSFWAKLRQAHSPSPQLSSSPQLNTGPQPDATSVDAQGNRVYNSRRPGMSPRPGGIMPRRRREKNLQREDYYVESVPPAIAAVLFEGEDMEYGGLEVNTKDMNGFDAMLATIYLESRKSSDGTFTQLVTEPGAKKTKLPKPRSMAQIVDLMDAQVPSEVTHEYARLLGEQSYEALSRNVYFSDGQRRYISQRIAREVQQIFDMHEEYSAYVEAKKEKARRRLSVIESEAPKSPAQIKKELMFELAGDLIFTPGFRKGPGYREEQRLLKLKQEARPQITYEQEATDWDQTAVQDEDQLLSELALSDTLSEQSVEDHFEVDKVSDSVADNQRPNSPQSKKK